MLGSSRLFNFFSYSSTFFFNVEIYSDSLILLFGSYEFY